MTTTTRYETQAEEIADLTAQLAEAKAMLKHAATDDEAQRIRSALRWIRNDLARAQRG